MMIDFKLSVYKQALNKQLKWPICISYHEQVPNQPVVLPDNAQGNEQTGSRGGHEPLR
jgi:hypothetical protein